MREVCGSSLQKEKLQRADYYFKNTHGKAIIYGQENSRNTSG